ncbi:MAG: hypothetical protein ABGX39_03460, partial [Methylococcales bacterium]
LNDSLCHAEHGMVLSSHSVYHSRFQRQDTHIAMVYQSSILQDGSRTRLLIGVLCLVEEP